ncbi:SWIRM domain-containing protein [Pilobolus umbonatus]|nr:SWIRM domain-containing protein [Pilobolus umbonatus]
MQPSPVDFNFYEQPSTISQFDTILQDLIHDLASIGVDCTVTAPELAYFTAHFLHFQQTQLDRLGYDEHIPTRIPFSFFKVETIRNPSPLYTILYAAYCFQSDKDMSDWQFNAPEERETYLELVDFIRRQLIEEGYYVDPVVAFDEGVNKDKVEEWTHMVHSMGGKIDTIPNATHIVYDNDDAVYNIENPTYVVEERRNGKAFIHYVGLPESYDRWVDDPGMDTIQHTNGPWHVRGSWVKDSYRYNEWMVPRDYDYPGKHLSRMYLKRPAEDYTLTSHTNPSKKVKTPIEENIPTNTPSSETPTPSILTAGEPTPPINLSEIPLPKEDPQRYLSVQSHDIIIPSYASWFDISEINMIESKALPEFFSSYNKSKTPTVYKEYRDFMINTYRMNPTEYLTITACRRNLTGDVCAILRVHSFLEQWGLINYQVDANVKPSSLSPPFDSQYKIVIKAPENRRLELAEDDIKQELIENPLDVKLEDVQPHECSTCHTMCHKLQFISVNNKDYHICQECFSAGKYTLDQNEDDFIAQTLDEEMTAVDEWTDEEDARLKEGIVQFKDNWDKIADHVETRTQEECILYYLELPTNDPLNNTSLKQLGLLRYNQSELSENPIMTAVAFLASTVDPAVAAAARGLNKRLPPAQPTTPEKESVKEEEAIDAEKEKRPDTKTEEEENELYDLMNSLFRHKLDRYQQQVSQYEELEELVEEEKRALEKNTHILYREQSQLKQNILKIQHEMSKRGNSSVSLSNIITPAQLQQQLAGIGPSIFMNDHRPNLFLQQLQHQQNQQSQTQSLQQSLHEQRQRQLQEQLQKPHDYRDHSDQPERDHQHHHQQQLQHQQQYPLQIQMQLQQQNSSRSTGQGLNNMMSL